MAWKVLSVDLPAIPRILVNYHFDSSGYQVKLTDLSRIWSDSLSKDEIVRRASDVGSSIDPSQDNEQFQILLTKIEGALSCEDGTSLSLTKDKEDGSSLRLDLTALLPRPLPAFQWNLHLSQQSQDHIDSELVTPLVLRSSNLERQIRQLIDDLHDKDRVISKICDRLETSGNDLTTVFPGVSNIKTSRKKSQREQLAKHVKGLEDFDEANFRARNATIDVDGEAGTRVMNEVFRDLPSSRAIVQNPGDWWKRLDNGSQVNIEKPDGNGDADDHQNHTGLSTNHIDKAHREESFQDDGFQRQGTPPHLKAPSSTEHSAYNTVSSRETGLTAQPQVEKPLDDESTTDEEDDLDATTRKNAPQKSTSPSVPTGVSPSPRKIGAIGGKPSPTIAERSTDGEAISQAPRSKFGVIGGRSKAATNTSDENDKASASQTSPSPKVLKMGTIGGKTSSTPNSPSPAAHSANAAGSAKEATPTRVVLQEKERTPAPREDPEELADKKRDQLKRELEEKAKAPVKKKRRF